MELGFLDEKKKKKKTNKQSFVTCIFVTNL